MKIKYDVIYADPPWSIQATSQVPSGRPGARPYSAMRQVDIFDMPIDEIASDNSVLFLWATPPLLPEAIYTMRAWGFEYKSVAFTWVKKNKSGNGWFWGMGWWTRSNPEFCLLGTKGNPKRVAANVHSVIDAPVGEHSEKPAQVRERIRQLCGEDKNYIELFSRGLPFPGWEQWGDQALALDKVPDQAMSN